MKMPGLPSNIQNQEKLYIIWNELSINPTYNQANTDKCSIPYTSNEKSFHEMVIYETNLSEFS